jgi:hypothetical protein
VQLADTAHQLMPLVDAGLRRGDVPGRLYDEAHD